VVRRPDRPWAYLAEQAEPALRNGVPPLLILAGAAVAGVVPSAPTPAAAATWSPDGVGRGSVCTTGRGRPRLVEAALGRAPPTGLRAGPHLRPSPRAYGPPHPERRFARPGETCPRGDLPSEHPPCPDCAIRSSTGQHLPGLGLCPLHSPAPRGLQPCSPLTGGRRFPQGRPRSRPARPAAPDLPSSTWKARLQRGSTRSSPLLGYPGAREPVRTFTTVLPSTTPRFTAIPAAWTWAPHRASRHTRGAPASARPMPRPVPTPRPTSCNSRPDSASARARATTARLAGWEPAQPPPYTEPAPHLIEAERPPIL